MEALKAILLQIPQGFLTGLLLNGTFILLAYFLFWKKFKQKFANWRIQIQNKVNNQQIIRELKNAVFTLLVGASWSGLILYLSTKGYTKIYTDLSAYSLFFAFFGFPILLLVDDAWFYWVHRLLHHPKIYKFVHYEHHKSIDVNPFTSLSFHFLEALLLTAWILPFSFIFPIYAPVLGLLQLWGLFDNLKAHLGYELYPAWWNKSFLRFLTSSTHHNMHHSKFNGNYGLHFRIWDKLLKTEFEDYESTFQEIQTRKNPPK
jgi:Delta7-sterol 5-desaturase